MKVHQNDRLIQLIHDTRNRYFSIPESVRGFKISDNKWSKREILGHLIDSARYNLQRFTEIPVFEGNYEIRDYPQDQLVKIHQYQTQPDFELLCLWQLLNFQIVQVITNIPEATLCKTIAVNRANKSLRELIEEYTAHVEHHLRQIFSGDISYLATPEYFQLSEAAALLKQAHKASNAVFIPVFSYADLQVEYYKPDEIDKQLPHLKDEVYVIASGRGYFYINGNKRAFSSGDIFYVKAGEKHYFTEFTADFATWVIFYGLHHYTPTS